MFSLVIVFNVNFFTYHLCLQCLHTFLGVISGRKIESMRAFYLCYTAILTNTLVPQPSLSPILQNQLGVALDALTGLQPDAWRRGLSVDAWQDGHVLPCGGRQAVQQEETQPTKICVTPLEPLVYVNQFGHLFCVTPTEGSR